ncbi:MAG: AAA family ATPase [Hyphomicrobiales bacterium]|nr:AAA family ATPase [Hyphomicrobiales bacterium]
MNYSDGDSQVLWEDGERVFRRGWRLDDDGQRRAVLMIVPTAEHPSRSSLDRLTHEYELKDQLDGAWAVRPLDLVRDAGRTTLVLEDAGGEPLNVRSGVPMEMGRFLRLAVAVAAALGKLHRHGLVHKDIKPANILVNGTTGEVRLTGFGIASRLARERPSPHPPEMIAGTLAYMAPEQTGRMNRSIDSRSDLYALGVTFYQILAGALPFTATDPMEWVHCHLARQPVAPAERLNEIPAAVSAIIMKLLAKRSEDRYQTAAGLESDLRRCQTEWDAQRRIDDFPLGEHDTPDRLLIPEKLYGRQREVETLLAAFDRVVKGGAPELVLVSGDPGVGKSSIVNELQKALLPRRGLFASGKFDQNKRDIPYTTFAQAFQRLVGMILAEPEAEHARYRDAILAAVEPYGQFIINLTPELERVIGKQPPISELAPQDALRVFHQVLRRFIGVFARPDCPLVIFVDDLQWLDTATLEALQHLLLQEDVKSLLLVGAYRDNEVGPDHPLLRCVDAIRRAGVPISDIKLVPLDLTDLHAMIAETLHDNDVLPLTELVHEKTAGNPLFASQFFTALADDGLIAFEPGSRRWLWDASRIASRRFTDNVVELMIKKIMRLPAPCREALRVMACIGNTVRVDALAAALDVSVSDLHASVRHAIDAGLVTLQSGAYTVLHDRIQEACYALIAEAERPSVHLRVGRQILTRTPAEKLDENLFEIVNQLNRGIELVSDRDELDRIAELNAKAGQRAKAATANVTALALLRTGAAVLGEAGWQRNRAVAFTLAFEQAECEFLMGDLEQAEARLSALVARAEGPRELAAVACLRIMLYVTRGEPARSVEVCLEYLKNEGIRFTPHPSREDVESELERMWRALGARSIEDLAQLPETADPATLATLDVLAAVASPAWFTDQLLPALIGARIANVSIERGNGPASSFGYSMLGMKLGPFSGDYRTAYRFGKLALELAERVGNPRTLARVLFGYAGFTRPWADDVSGCRELLERGFEAAERAGDVTYATYLLYHVEELMLIAGSPLDETEAACRRALSYARKLNFDFAVLQVQPQLALARMLRGDSVRFGSFDSPEFDQDDFERICRGVPALTSPLCRYWFRRQQAQFLAGDARGSVAAAEAAGPLLWCADVFPQFAEYHFYGALARAECLDSADEAARPNLREQLKAHVTKLAQFGENSPVTFGSRAALAAAEFARIEGREQDAMTLYERAIHSARAAGFTHVEALSFELAARSYAARGFETIANTYLREARFCYQRWGADGKVRQLETMYPRLREPEPGSRADATIAAPVEQLDLATVIKVSQSVSGEMVLEKLIDGLMRAAIEHAGAERGLLITPRSEELHIDAEATARGEDVIVQLRDGDRTAAVLPESLVRYAMRTRETLILDDASSQNAFSADPYIVGRRARSILCLPLINQGKLTGILYLENNLTPRVFTADRVTVLKVLASQAAISLENTRLYRDLADREGKIRRLVDANIVGILMADVDGRVFEANDEFLRIIGYDREDLISGRIRRSDLTPPEWRGQSERAVAELRSTGRVQPFEKEYFRKDGSRVPVLVGLALFEESANEGFAFVLDLTERKQAEEALRESERSLRSTIDGIPGHVGILAPNGDIEAVNRQILEYCGQSLEELKNWGANGTVHPEDLPYVIEVFTKSIASGIPYQIEQRLRRFDGQYRWFDNRGIPIRDDSGRVTRWYVLLTEIEDRVQALARLHQIQSDFAHINRVSTMGELAASLSHEITQPIASARNNARAALNFLDQQPSDLAEVREALACIVGDADRAGAIVERIREQIKKAPPRKERFDLNAAIDEVIVLARSAIMKNGVLVQTRLAHGLLPVQGDRVQLQQVVLNLVLNAVEAMASIEAEPRELSISTEQDETGVGVAVSDTGPGVDPEHHERVFEAFYTTKSSGVGMGLSICRSIINAHGGRLWAEANEPRGATFQFTLPANADVTS